MDDYRCCNDWYIMNDKSDFDRLRKQTDITYEVVGEDQMIYYQNGIQNTLEDAKKGRGLLSKFTGVPEEKIAVIHNKTDGKSVVGLMGDLKEYSNDGLKTKDVVNAKILEDISKNGEQNTIIAFSAGNKDAQKAMEVLALEGRNLGGTVEYISVGSPVKMEDLKEVSEKVGINVVSQHNTWKDPVANTMAWVGATGGTAALGTLVGVGAGASLASGAGPVSAYFGALVGGGVGGGVGLHSLHKYHSLESYLQKDTSSIQSTLKDIGDREKSRLLK